MNKANKIIVVIVGTVIIAGGSFYAGLVYGKTTNPITARAGQFAGGAGFAGGRGAGARGVSGSFVSGQVLSSDNTSITVKLRTGGSQIILLSSSTTVMKSTEGSIKDIMTGEQITAMGSQNADGSITAGSIQVRPGNQN
jgi:hypothetical protein